MRVVKFYQNKRFRLCQTNIFPSMYFIQLKIKTKFTLYLQCVTLLLFYSNIRNQVKIKLLFKCTNP